MVPASQVLQRVQGLNLSMAFEIGPYHQSIAKIPKSGVNIPTEADYFVPGFWRGPGDPPQADLSPETNNNKMISS